MRSSYFIFILLYITILHGISELYAQSKNGFDLQDALIPVDQILSGGPPRDGIPSIDDPKFVEAMNAVAAIPGERRKKGSIKSRSKKSAMRYQ